MKNKPTLLKKAYEIDFSKIEEGYLASEQWCYAKTRNEARNTLLAQIYYDEWQLKWEDEPITYLTIPIKRKDEYDLVLFDGKEIRRHQVSVIIEEKSRIKLLDDMLSDESIKYCYILKGGNYYRPNSCGYTAYQFRAGVYTKEEAVNDAKFCKELYIKPVSVDEHNRIINEEIETLTKNLIAL